MLASHPRLSISSLCSWSWSFEQDLDMWTRIGAHHVGLLAAKVDAFGREDAIAALRERGIVASTVVAGGFDLRRPDTWEAARATFTGAIDTACALGAGCIYVTTGRTTGAPWRDVLETFAAAVAPVVAYGTSRNMRVAIEPSLRTDVSFVHSLRDALVVSGRTGLDVIADIGNCWMERDVEEALREAGSRIALIQVADVVIGTMGHPGPGGRAVPGDGELPLERWLRAALSTGYEGQIDLEMVGPAIEAEGYETAVRRAVERMNEILLRVLG